MAFGACLNFVLPLNIEQGMRNNSRFILEVQEVEGGGNMRLVISAKVSKSECGAQMTITWDVLNSIMFWVYIRKLLSRSYLPE